jgi:uncharacterized protein (DUF1015 family)
VRRTLPRVTELFSPLRGLCPVPERAAEIAELPYDVMSRDEAIAMADGRPHSFLHVSRPDIDLPLGAAVEQTHRLADRALSRLVDDGLLVRDKAPRFYLYRMTDGQHQQTGIVGAASIAAYESGRIRRHETTRPDKQAERARQIDAVNAQTGPVYLVHRPDLVVEQVLAEVMIAAATTVVDGPGGVRHELWPVHDDDAIARLAKAFDAMPALYIADGHHRSAAAAVVHAERATPATARFLAVTFPSDQVRILPYNRIVRAPAGMSGAVVINALAARFALEPADSAVLPRERHVVGVYADGRWSRLRLPAAEAGTGTSPKAAVAALDVAILQREVLHPLLGIADPRTDPRIGFVGGVRPPEQLEAAVDGGAWTVAFTMHATSIEQLLAVADAGGIMPPKSTWFEPKLLDGLVSLVLD